MNGHIYIRSKEYKRGRASGNMVKDLKKCSHCFNCGEEAIKLYRSGTRNWIYACQNKECFRFCPPDEIWAEEIKVGNAIILNSIRKD